MGQTLNVIDHLTAIEIALLRDYDQRLARMQDKLEDVKREMAEASHHEPAPDQQ